MKFVVFVFFMESAAALDVSLTLLSIPLLFLFHCPLLFVYPPACLGVFTLMSFSFGRVEVSHHMLISKAWRAYGCTHLIDCEPPFSYHLVPLLIKFSATSSEQGG